MTAIIDRNPQGQDNADWLGAQHESAGLVEASPILPALSHSISDDGIPLTPPEETSDGS